MSTRVPIECRVNTALLYARERDVVQFDLTYYNARVRRIVEEYASTLRSVVVRRDASGNLVVYLAENAERLEAVWKRHDGTVEGGFQTVAFSRMLDKQFYVCARGVRDTLQQPNLVRVSIDVVEDAHHVGAILVQMLPRRTLQRHLAQVYARFLSLTRVLEGIDPSLQTQLSLYTKPGKWKDSPEFVTRALHELPP